MGISRGNIICQALGAKSLLFSVSGIGVPVEYEPKTDANLYIDGLLLLYSAKIVSNVEPMLIIQNKLRKIISVVASRYNILDVHVFFDGDAPPEKAETQKKRANRASNFNFNIHKVKQDFCNRIHFPPISINNLRRGEAEMEMYRLRDTRATSIMYTKDTDFFTIAYGHTAPDDVVYCQERGCVKQREYNFFDMRKFKHESIPGVVFSTLMALAGTDYTETRLSLTQVKCILNNAHVLALGDAVSDDPTIEEISNLINVICEFLSNRRYERRTVVSKARNYSLIKEAEYLKVVLWYVRYIKYGFDYA
jgi:hypothetical protein